VGRGSLRGRRSSARYCTDKRPFLTPEEAAEEHPGQRPYLCPACGSWHLTSEVVGLALPKKHPRHKKRARAFREQAARRRS
jgi:hypothetical protein